MLKALIVFGLQRKPLTQNLTLALIFSAGLFLGLFLRGLFLFTVVRVSGNGKMVSMEDISGARTLIQDEITDIFPMWSLFISLYSPLLLIIHSEKHIH